LPVDLVDDRTGHGADEYVCHSSITSWLAAGHDGPAAVMVLRAGYR
jgi:hypothetical protein